MSIKVNEPTPTGKIFLDSLYQDEYSTYAWYGSVRSGKTVSACIGLNQLAMDYLLRGEGNNNFMMAGPTQGAVVRNTSAYMKEIADHYGFSFRQVGGQSPHFLVGNLFKYFLFGTEKSNSHIPLLGMTLTAGLIDETQKAKDEFIETTQDRLTFDNSKLILCMNTESKRHPIYQKYIGEDRPPNCKVLESDYWENQHYSDKRREERIATSNPNSYWYKRNILNEWCPAEGLVFPIEDRMVRDEPHDNWGVIGVDIGIAGTTAALLAVPTAYGYHIADEYYHDGRNLTQLTEEVHLANMLARWQVQYFIVDPSATSFRLIAGNNFRVDSADNDIKRGVLATNHALYNGKLTISPKCKNLLSELDSYVWNEVTEKPIKKDDHAADALRYLTYGLIPLQQGGVW